MEKREFKERRASRRRPNPARGAAPCAACVRGCRAQEVGRGADTRQRPDHHAVNGYSADGSLKLAREGVVDLQQGGGGVALQMVHLGGPGNGQHDRRLLEQPGERHLSRRGAL